MNLVAKHFPIYKDVGLKKCFFCLNQTFLRVGDKDFNCLQQSITKHELKIRTLYMVENYNIIVC